MTSPDAPAPFDDDASSSGPKISSPSISGDKQDNDNQYVEKSTDGGPDDDNDIEDEVLSPAKKKLDSMVLGDGTFEALMKERTRLRKEKDEHSIAQLRIQLTSAERALSIEIQRRIDSTASIQRSCTERIAQMEDHFARILHERSARMEDRLLLLQQKIDELSRRFEEDKERIPKEVERRGEELSEMVSEFRRELQEERSDRLSREGRILKQMDDHGSQIMQALQKESDTRETVTAGLQQRIKQNEDGREASEREYAALVERELGELRALIERESYERRVEDDQIVSALNRYTQQLQSSLSVISS